MAQKSTREGLKKEYVDYLGNLIIEGKIKEDILKLGNENYPTLNKFNNLIESLNNEIEARIASDNNIIQDISELRDTKANKSDVLTLEEIQASTDLTGKIASASALTKLFRRYHLVVNAHSEITLDLSDLERNREYLLLYTTTNGAYVSGGVLLSTAQSNPSVIHLSDKVLSSFSFSINYPTLTISNNEDYLFDTYITIIG